MAEIETQNPLITGKDGRPLHNHPNQHRNTSKDKRGPIIGCLICSGIVLLFFVLLIRLSFHHVDEGFVAVYYRGGALLNSIGEPGYRMMIPFITSYKQIQVTIQTDEVRNVPCGTAGGVIIYFERIEVVNLLRKDAVYNIVKNYTADYDKPLIYNKVHHEINQMCSRHTIQEIYIDLFDKLDETLKNAIQIDLETMAPGLSVQAVRVTKPTIPESIANNYVKMESEKTELLVAEQHQKVVEKIAETDRKKAIIDAEKMNQVAEINHRRAIAEKEMEKTINSLQDQIHLAKQKALADAEFYKTAKAAEANEKLLTSNYLESKRIEAIHDNNKIFYGNSIPNAFFNSDLSLQQQTPRKNQT